LQPSLKEQDELIDFILRTIEEFVATSRTVPQAFEHVEGLLEEHMRLGAASELKKCVWRLGACCGADPHVPLRHIPPPPPRGHRYELPARDARG
jgi:hypothetical protein